MQKAELCEVECLKQGKDHVSTVVSKVKLVDLDDSMREKIQNAVASTLTITNAKDFSKREPFVKPWYPADDKLRKTKLGSIHECCLKSDSDMVCRVIKFDRISSYQVESYFAQIAKLHYMRMQDFLLLPKGIRIEGENEINLIEPRKFSLYEVIHAKDATQLSLTMKLTICLRIARILNTLHQQHLFYGNLSSHNLMFEPNFSKDPQQMFKLYLTELELQDFMKYANMFGSYRNASVWSAPEVLKQPRKHLDPTAEMDVYSFGMLMWEVMHDTVPFDGDLKICTEYVVNSESRPKIDAESNRSPTELEERTEASVSERMADLIRTCW